MHSFRLKFEQKKVLPQNVTQMQADVGFIPKHRIFTFWGIMIKHSVTQVFIVNSKEKIVVFFPSFTKDLNLHIQAKKYADTN